MKIIDEIVEKLKRFYKPEKIILYGSYAWGKLTQDSDIDILIIKDTTASRMDRYIEVSRLLDDFRLRVEISPLIYTEKELEKRVEMGDDFIIDILGEGIVLYDKEKGRVSQRVV